MVFNNFTISILLAPSTHRIPTEYPPSHSPPLIPSSQFFSFLREGEKVGRRKGEGREKEGRRKGEGNEREKRRKGEGRKKEWRRKG